MIINATAKLHYNDGIHAISSDESLDLYVEFKVKGRLRKVKLHRTLVTAFYYHNWHLVPKDEQYKSMDEYYDDVERVMNDTEYIERCAIEMIQKYFDKMKKDSNEYDRKSNIVKKTKELPKIEIKVEIK